MPAPVRWTDYYYFTIMATSAGKLKQNLLLKAVQPTRLKLCICRECQEILTYCWSKHFKNILYFSVIATSLCGGWKWKRQAILWSSARIKRTSRRALWCPQPLQTKVPRVMSYKRHPRGMELLWDLFSDDLSTVLSFRNFEIQLVFPFQRNFWFFLAKISV